MSTYILNSNDTIVFSDSIVVKTEKMTDACQNSMSEAATNCQDVMIVLIICVAIVLVALIVKWALWSWKESELKAQEKEFQNKKEKEEAESLRKQEADLVGKKLDVLKNVLEKKIFCPEEKDVINKKEYIDAIDEELKSLKKRLQTLTQKQTAANESN